MVCLFRILTQDLSTIKNRCYLDRYSIDWIGLDYLVLFILQIPNRDLALIFLLNQNSTNICV